LVSTDSKGFKSVKYGNIIGIVIEAIKELKTMIMNLINDQDEIKAEQQKMWDEIKTLREENRQLRQDLQEKKKMELRK
jgi:regulator of replication initiation timing